MLPETHQHAYRHLLAELETLHHSLLPEQWRVDFIKASFMNLQQIFQTQVLPLDLDSLDPKVEHHVQSFNVEINKQLRLLSVDTTFLQSAKQPETIQQRLSQVRDRVAILIRYCKAILSED